VVPVLFSSVLMGGAGVVEIGVVLGAGVLRPVLE
jgi:hypothetical protein